MLSKNAKNRLERLIYTVASVGSVFALWWVVAKLNWVSPYVLPPPWQVMDALVQISQGYMGTSLIVHFNASMSVVLSGFLLAILVGVPLGMMMAFIPAVDRLFGPLIMILRPVPPPAWIPLAILWFGIGLPGKVFVVFVAAIVPCLLNAYLGVRETPAKLIDVSRMLGASRWTVFKEVVVPSALPVVLTGIRIALGNAWATLVAAELVVSTAGFGFLLITGYRNFQDNIMAAAMFPIAIIGALMNFGFLMLEKKLVPWRREDEQ